MKVSEQCVVELTWTLRDASNDMLDELDQPVAFLVGGDDLLPAIDAALLGHSAGDTVNVQLEPEAAFGQYDEELVLLEPRHLFDADIEPGTLLDGLPEGCNPDAAPDALYHVTDIYPDHVVLDGNHPLAGMALRLCAKLHSVREATLGEIGAGSLGAGFFKLGAAGGDDGPAETTVH